RTGAMLSIGQESSRENAALAAESGCEGDSKGAGRSSALVEFQGHITARAAAAGAFQALGIEFVSLTEGVDTSTPAGKMVFTVLGAVAELERSLIVEGVKAGLRNTRAKGKRLGRPQVAVDAHRIAGLRAEGLSWVTIC